MKNLINFLLGIVILTLGITLMSITSLGIGSWDSVNFGLSGLLNINISSALIITSTIVLIITSIIKKEIPKISTFITAIFIGIVLDIWKVIFSEIVVDAIYTKYIIFILGLVISSFGIALYLTSRFPQNPIDYLTVTIKEKFKIKIGISKLIVDIICILVGIAVGGPMGIGTVIATLLTGPIVDIMCNILIKANSTKNILELNNNTKN